MQLKHISHGHFYLTAHQARHLAVGNKLPAEGYERQMDRSKLPELELVVRNYRLHRWEPIDTNAVMLRSAWIYRTPMVWWDGQPVKDGWVWCVHLYWAAPLPWESLGLNALHAMIRKQNEIPFSDRPNLF